MKSRELANRIIALDDETKIKIFKDLPIAIYDVANKVIDEILIAGCYENTSQGEILMQIFLQGYMAARAEDRITLEDIFLNTEEQ